MRSSVWLILFQLTEVFFMRRALSVLLYAIGCMLVLFGGLFLAVVLWHAFGTLLEALQYGHSRDLGANHCVHAEELV